MTKRNRCTYTEGFKNQIVQLYDQRKATKRNHPGVGTEPFVL
ncbi:hypothetical protein [Virgibacillus salarius]